MMKEPLGDLDPLNHPESERLTRLLESLGLRIRVLGGIRAILGLFVFAVSFLGLSIYLDYRLHLDSALRALALGGGLAAAYMLGSWLLRPCRAENIDMRSLAARIEEAEPSLGDALSSAVHFLEEPKSVLGTSAQMQIQVISGSLDRVTRQDLESRIVIRGMVAAFLLALVVGLAGTAALVHHYPLSLTALKRTLFPYAQVQWPTRTRIELGHLRRKIGSNEILQIRGDVHGEIPQDALIRLRTDGTAPRQMVMAIGKNPETGHGEFQARLEAGTLGTEAFLEIEAGDASTGWIRLEVLEPPQFLSPGKTDPPAWTVLSPEYTGMPEKTGATFATSAIEMPRGGIMIWNARVNRPVVRGRLVFHPEVKELVSAALSSLPLVQGPLEGSVSAGICLALLSPGETRLDERGMALAVRFQPLASGVIHWIAEDEQGLFATMSQEIHVQEDPSPVVEWKGDRSAGPLLLLPQGAWSLKAQINDPFYGLKSVRLESTEDGPVFENGVLQQFSLRENDGKPAPQIRTSQAALDLKPSQWKKKDGSSWKASERFLVRVVADDHDDVLPLKSPGASPWVEVRIADRNLLDLALEKEQEKARQELLRAQKPQTEAIGALEKVHAEMKQSRESPGELRENLAKMEQEHRLLRDRVLDRESGLMGDLESARRMAMANGMKSSPSLERVQELLRDLGRVESTVLPAVQKQVSDALRKAEGEEMTPEARKAEVENVLAGQKELEKELKGMLEKLEPFAGIREMRSNAREVLAQMEEMRRRMEDMRRDAPQNAGKQRSELDEKSREKLDSLGEQQSRLERDTGSLLDKLDKASREGGKQNEAQARAMRGALEKPEVRQLRESMTETKREVEANQITQAMKSQERSRDGLQEILESLEDRTVPQAERLARKLREAASQIRKAQETVEQLKKKQGDKTQEKQSAQEGQMLASDLEDLARNLSRMNEDFDAENLEKAAQMLRRQEQEQGARANENLEKVQERLQREMAELEKQIQEVEAQLQRERLEKIADMIRQLLQRQEALIAESSRLDQLLNEKGAWSRAQLLSIAAFSRAQAGMAEEVQVITSRDLEGLPVFAKVVSMARNAMMEASQEAARNPRTQAKGPPMAQKVAPLQREASLRLNQFLDAIKEEMSDLASGQEAAREKGDNPDQPKGEGESQGQRQGAPSSKPPSRAQLKLLRNLQADLLGRTSELSQKYPNTSEMKEEDRKKMVSLQKDQREVGELMQLFLDALPMEKPGEDSK